MKAVLVINMPTDCPECPMAHWNKLDEFTGCDAVSGKKYAINDKEYAESSCRPSWCPLRPLPQKKEVDEQSLDLMWWSGGHDMAYDAGYNACLKEITGEEE